MQLRDAADVEVARVRHLVPGKLDAVRTRASRRRVRRRVGVAIGSVAIAVTTFSAFSGDKAQQIEAIGEPAVAVPIDMARCDGLESALLVNACRDRLESAATLDCADLSFSTADALFVAETLNEQARVGELVAEVLSEHADRIGCVLDVCRGLEQERASRVEMVNDGIEAQWTITSADRALAKAGCS